MALALIALLPPRCGDVCRGPAPISMSRDLLYTAGPIKRPHEIRLRDDADQPVLAIDDGDVMMPMLGKDRHQVCHGPVRARDPHVGAHDLADRLGLVRMD